MKKKILFTIDSLNIGGAEKSLVTLLNLLDYKKYDVDLQLFAYGGTFEQFLPKEVKVLEPINYSKFLSQDLFHQLLSIRNFFARIKYSILLRQKKLSHSDRARYYWNTIGKRIERSKVKYDIAIGYGQCIPTFYTIDKVQADKKYVWVNCVFNLNELNKDYQRHFYSKANKIAIVSEKALEKFKSLYPEFAEKMKLVLDMYDSKLIQDMSLLKSEKEIDNSVPVFMTTGRLNEPQKGYDIALETAKCLKEKGIKFHWYAIGEGPYRAEMERYIKNHELEDYFILLGATPNPYSYMRQCDIYIQTSKFEGFGLALAEAKTLNIPIICTPFKACFMQINNGINGIISTFNPTDIANTIELLLKDKNLYLKIKDNLSKEKKGNTEEIENFYKLLD